MSELNATIFAYTSFAKFLADYCEMRRRDKPTFSQRWLTKRAGLKSASLLSMIILGERRATLDTALKLAQAMNLNPKEEEYALLIAELDLDRSQYINNLVATRVEELRASSRDESLERSAY